MSHQYTLFNTPEHIENKDAPIYSNAKPRLKVAVRNQVEITMASLEDLIPEDHKVRLVWRYVSQLDFSEILGKIKSVESNPGAPAIDPKILLSVWLLAFIEGITSAKVINRYCKEHVAFKWLCGKVPVNEHTISDFRTKHGEAFDDLLTQSIGVLTHQGLVKIDSIAQDGMKVEAHAGRSSFRREKTLKEHLKQAKDYVEALKNEVTESSNGISKKQAAAKKRAAENDVKRTTRAIEELKKLRQQKAAEAKRKGKSFSQKDKEKVRASKTDPEARVMKMPNSGFAPAYNVQFATGTEKKIIVGVSVTNSGHDYGQLTPMQKQVRDRLGYTPSAYLADPGYLQLLDVEEASKESFMYIPCDDIKTEKKLAITEMKNRMETKEAKEIYKQRAATAEFVNARTRTRGLTQFLVAGIAKAQVVATLFAIGNNMLVWISNQ